MPTLSTLGAACARAWGFTSGLVKDQYFNLVSLLLPGNGTNGATNNSFVDSSTANSGTGWPITRNGDVTQGTFSPFSQTGWGVYFPGSTSTWINAPDNAVLELGSNDFTIECWVYATSSFSALRTFTSKYNHFVLSINTTPALSFNWYGSSSSSSIGTLVDTSINKWHHFAVCRSGSTLYMFQNGQQLSLTNSTITGTLNNDATGPMIGGNSNQSGGSIISANDPWIGYISNYRLTNGAALYTSGFTPSTSPLTTTSQGASASQVEWLTCQSNRFKDNSNNDFSLTVTGSPSVTPFSPFAPTSSYSAAAVGGSGYFDGSGDYLTAPTGQTPLTIGTSSFTISFWFYCPAQVQTNGTLFASNASVTYTNAILSQFSSTAATTLELAMGGSIIKTGIAVVPNQWNFVVIQRTAPSTMQMWVNGSEVTGVTASSANLTDNDWRVAYWFTGAHALTGYISNFRIVKGTALYSGSTITVPTAPLGSTGSDTSLLLNFTNGGVIDATAKNDLQTVNNAQISTSSKQFGTGSIYLPQSGTYDYLKIRQNPTLELGSGNFTVECWINLTAHANFGAIACKGPVNTTDSTTWSIQFNGTNNTLAVYIYAASSGTQIIVGSANVISVGWVHVALSRSGSNTVLFVNGNKDGSTYSGSYTIGAGNDLYVGTQQVGTNDFSRTITGYVDDLRITDGYARYVEGTGGNAGKMVFNGTNTLALPTAPFPLQ